MNDTVQIFKIPSNPSGIHTVESIIESCCYEQSNFSKELYGNILIAATEAFSNALYHGNKQDSKKHIYLEIDSTDDYIQLIITDEGDGFDYKNISDPTLPENLLKETGRGIFIMKSLSDECEFMNNGKSVRLKFNL